MSKKKKSKKPNYLSHAIGTRAIPLAFFVLDLMWFPKPCMCSFVLIFFFLLGAMLLPVRPSSQLLTKLLLVRSTPSACLYTSQTFCILQEEVISLLSRLDLLYFFCDLCSGLGLCSFEIREMSQIN